MKALVQVQLREDHLVVLLAQAYLVEDQKEDLVILGLH